jgi:hypothetical protein
MTRTGANNPCSGGFQGRNAGERLGSEGLRGALGESQVARYGYVMLS